MSFLPHFRFASVSRAPVVASGPSAPPLMLCLDLGVRTPGESERTGGSRASAADESEGEDTSSSRGGPPDESEGEDSWNSCGSSADESEDEGACANSPDDAVSLANSRSKGSFNWDREKGGFSLEWTSMAEFQTWRETEERACSIEFTRSSTRAGGKHWSRWQRFVCGREKSGGEKVYEKKHPERQRKIGTKKSGCGCHIIIKEYPHTSTILGRYVAEHDHDLGACNIAYTRLSGATRERIKLMLTQKIDPHEIVSLPKKLNRLAPDLIYLQVRVIRDSTPDHSRDHLIALKEVNQIARVLENDKIRLHHDDAISTQLLIEQLAAEGTRIVYKNKQDRDQIPPGIPEDAFVLCIQTEFQLDAFRRLGSGFIGIDATHNITQYQDLLLFTIIARDRWGRGTVIMIFSCLVWGAKNTTGVPVAWMLTSSGTTALIKFFLTWVRDASPDVRPGVIMTDRDQAQIAALEAVYPQSRVFLCTWHVLRAIRGHFVTTQFPALWEKIKAWVITEDTAMFFNIWDEISSDPLVPQSVVKYLRTEWLPVLHMWSRISRKDRSIFEEGNTNMLIEAYVLIFDHFAIITLT